MNNNKVIVKNNSITFFEVLQVVFIVLKLLGLINWSWFWVLSPIWISVIWVIFVILLAYLIAKW